MDVTENDEKHSDKWRMFMSVTLESAVFMGKNYLDNCYPITNTKDLTLEQMFDISARLVSEQDRISGVETIGWENHSWKYLIFDWWWKCYQSSTHKGPRLFGFCVVSWSDTRETPIKQCMGRQIDVVQKFSGIQKLWQNRRRANGIRVEYFPRIQYVAAQSRSQTFAVEIRWDTREFYRKDYLHVDVQRHLMWIKRQWKRMRVKCSTRFSFCKKTWNRTMIMSWSWFREEVVFYQCRQSTRWMRQNGGEDDVRIRRKRTSNFPCYKSIVQRSAQNQRWRKLSIHYCADQETIKTVFRTIVSAYQLSLYGAVAEMCEEYETFHDRTGQPVVGGQSSSSFVPSVIKTDMLLGCDDFARKDLLLRQYGERIENLSQQDNLSKFCMDAGFLNVVEVGQYFLTKDTE